jgi:hypothetical protein
MKIIPLELAASSGSARALEKTPAPLVRSAPWACAQGFPKAMTPRQFEQTDYRWSISIATTKQMEQAARVFSEALAWAWPGDRLDLSAFCFANPEQGQPEALGLLRAHPRDLIFVIDDPLAPDDVNAFLTLAAQARLTPVLLADPGTSEDRRVPALILGCYPTELGELAWGLAQWGMLAVLARGLVCVDWLEILNLLDAPGGRAILIHEQGMDGDETRKRYRNALEARLGNIRYGRLRAMHTTIAARELRMSQVRACVQTLRSVIPEPDQTWFTYATPLVEEETWHIFGMLVFDGTPE